MSTFLTPKVNNKDKVIPTKLSELINDVGFIRDTNYKHTDNNFTDSYKSILDNSESAINVISKANLAANRANLAADRVEQIKDNFPKIIDNRWYIYNDETELYEDTGVIAKGESFKIKKTYPSISEMIRDSDNLTVGDFVLIDSDVDDPDNSKLYVKTETELKFLSDLSGSVGITGFSAYEIAVNNGYKGSESEWVESLSVDSKNAAKVALKTVDKMNVAMSDLSDLRFSLETTKNTVIETDNTIKENEQERQLKESERINAEAERKSAEEERSILNGQLIQLKSELESTKTDLENTVEETVSNANIVVNQLKTTVNNTVEKAELDINTAIANAESQMSDIITNSNEAINDVNNTVSRVDSKITEADNAIKRTESATIDTVAKTEAAATATTNANLAATNANTQANRAKNYSDNPPTIISGFWYLYDENLKSYVNTNVRAEGLKGDTGSGVTIKGSLSSVSELPTNASEGDSYLIDGYLYIYLGSGGNVTENPAWDNVGKIQGPPGSDATVTKEAVESVLVGNINTHNHNNTYYTKTELDSKDAPSDNNQYVRYNGEWVAVDLSSVDPYEVVIEDDITVTEEEYNNLLNAIENKRRISIEGAINPVAVFYDGSVIRIDYIFDLCYIVAHLDKTLKWKTYNNELARIDDIEDISPKSIDHIPTEDDIVYNGTRYKIGTIVYYNNKFYRLYSITNNKADWREIGSNSDITSKLINENENFGEFNDIIIKFLVYVFKYKEGLVNYPFTVTNFNDICNKILSNGIIIDSLYNYGYSTFIMNDPIDESEGIFHGNWLINLSCDSNKSQLILEGKQISSFTRYLSKFQILINSDLSEIAGHLNVNLDDSGDKHYFLYSFNSTSITAKDYTITINGDGTKFLNDKGSYSEIKDLQLTKLISTDGVFAVTADLKLVDKSEFTFDCVGLAIIDKSQNLAIMVNNRRDGVLSSTKWGFFETDIESITEETSGKVNTQTLKNLEANSNITSQINSFLSSEDALGYNDWYIPSKMESEKIVSSGYWSDLLLFSGTTNFVIPDSWWTSTEHDSTSVYAFDRDGGIVLKNKNDYYNTLFIRDLPNIIDPDQIDSPLSKFIETNSNKLLEEHQNNIPEGAIVYNKEDDKLYFNNVETGHSKVGNIPLDLINAINGHNASIIKKYLPKSKSETYSYYGLENHVSLQWVDDDTCNILVDAIFDGNHSLYIFKFKVSTGELITDSYYYSYLNGRSYNSEGVAETISIGGSSVEEISGENPITKEYSLDLILNGKGNKYLNDKGQYTEPLVPSDELKTLLINLMNKNINDVITTDEYTLLNDNLGHYIIWDESTLFNVLVFKPDSNINIVYTSGVNRWVFIINNERTIINSWKYVLSIRSESGGILIETNEEDNTQRNILLKTEGDGTKVLADNGQYVPMSADADETLSVDSTNPIQNKAVATKFSTQYIPDHSVFAYKDGKLVTSDKADNTCTAIVVYIREYNKLYMIEKNIHENCCWGEEGVNVEGIADGNTDLLGKENSEILKSLGGTQTIGTELNNFLLSSDALGFDDWYIPSGKELEIILENKRAIIDNVLTKIEGTLFNDLVFWTSSESSKDYAYYKSSNSSGNRLKTALLSVRFIRELDISQVPSYEIDSNVKYVTFEKNIDLKECAYLNLLSDHVAISEDVGGTYDNGTWTSYVVSNEELSILFNIDLEVESNRPLFLDWINKIIPVQNVLYKLFASGEESILTDSILSFDGTVLSTKQTYEIHPYSPYTMIYQISTSTWELTSEVKYNTIQANNGNIEITSVAYSGDTADESSITLKIGGRGNTALTNSGEYSSFIPGEYAGLYKDGVYAIDSDGNFISEDKYDSNGTYTGISVVIKGKAYQCSPTVATVRKWNSEAIDIEGLTNYNTVDGVNSEKYIRDLPDDIEKWPTEGAVSSFDGKSNTEAILAGLDNTQDNIAKAIVNYRAKNGSEWFVPSVGQLAFMMKDNYIRTLYSKIYNMSSIFEYNNHKVTSDELDQNYYWYINYYNLKSDLKIGGTLPLVDCVFLKEIDFPQPLLLKEVPCRIIDTKLSEALEGILSSDSTIKSNAVDYLIANIKPNTKQMYLGTTSGNNDTVGLVDHVLIVRDVLESTDTIAVKFANLYGWLYSNYPIYNSIIGINTNTKEVSIQSCSVSVSENGFSYVISRNGEQQEGVLVSKKALFNTFFGQFNNVTDITSLPIDKYGIKASLSTSQTLGFASTPTEGMEFMIDIKNTSSSSITISFPSTMQYDVPSITIESGKIYSISVRYIFSTYCVRC